MKKIDVLYLETIEKLKNNQRPLLKLDEEFVFILIEAFENLKLKTNQELELELKKILCLLSHTQNFSLKFLKYFKEICENKLKFKLTDDLIIYYLTASEKQIISPFLKEGHPLPEFYVLYLKSLLKHSNPEVLEWTLRTISSTGPFTKLFKIEIRNLKPKLHLIFNKHQRWAFEIIDFLEKEWKHLNL